MGTSLTSIYREGLEEVTCERKRLTNIFKDAGNNGSQYSVLRHNVGNSGFFSEMESLVASCLTASMIGAILDVDLSATVYRDSIYFMSVIEDLRSRGRICDFILSEHVPRCPSAKKYISALRCLGHIEYMCQSDGLSHAKRELYKKNILPCLKEVYQNKKKQDSNENWDLSELRQHIQPKQDEFTLFLRGGDKTQHESLLCSPKDILSLLFRSYCFEKARSVPARLTVVSDDYTLALSVGQYLSSSYRIIAPPRNTDGGYRHAEFISLCSEERCILESRIIHNFLRIALSCHITGDPSSNLMNASIYASHGNYIDLAIWGSYPQVCF
jgi:hypothetical protein